MVAGKSPNKHDLCLNSPWLFAVLNRKQLSSLGTASGDTGVA